MGNTTCDRHHFFLIMLLRNVFTFKVKSIKRFRGPELTEYMYACVCLCVCVCVCVCVPKSIFVLEALTGRVFLVVNKKDLV